MGNYYKRRSFFFETYPFTWFHKKMRTSIRLQKKSGLQNDFVEKWCVFCKILKESGLQFDHQTLKGSFAKFLERVLECRLISEDKGFYEKLHTLFSTLSRSCTIKRPIFSRHWRGWLLRLGSRRGFSHTRWYMKETYTILLLRFTINHPLSCKQLHHLEELLGLTNTRVY